MQVILKQDIEKLGQAGEVVTVKNGYARNFLFPKGLALFASPGNLRLVEKQKEKAILIQKEQKQQAEDLAQKIGTVSCTITVHAGEDGKLYGSVTSQDIAEGFKSEGIIIDKRKIELAQPIKEVGVFRVQIKLHPEVTAEAKVWVVKQ